MPAPTHTPLSVGPLPFPTPLDCPTTCPPWAGQDPPACWDLDHCLPPLPAPLPAPTPTTTPTCTTYRTHVPTQSHTLPYKDLGTRSAYPNLPDLRYRSPNHLTTRMPYCCHWRSNRTARGCARIGETPHPHAACFAVLAAQHAAALARILRAGGVLASGWASPTG